MKVLAKVVCVAAMVSIVAGCACNKCDVYVPKVPPGAQSMLLDYFNQPENKVFVIAVDPNGEFAAGFDYGKVTLEEAAEVAYETCKANREALGVVGGYFVYAINDEVVYEKSIASWQKMVAEKEAAEKAAAEQAAAEQAAAEQEAALEEASIEDSAEDADVEDALEANLEDAAEM